MVNITLFELHFDDASFSSSAIFGGSDEAEETTDDSEASTETPEFPVPRKAVAAVGVLVALVAVGAVVKRLLGGDEPAVDIETRDQENDNRPVGIAVDE